MIRLTFTPPLLKTLGAGCTSSKRLLPGSWEFCCSILTKVSTSTINFVIFSSNSVITFDSSSAFDCLTNKESVFLRLAHFSFVPLSIFVVLKPVQEGPLLLQSYSPPLDQQT